MARRRYSRRRNIGYERAREHIRQAEALSRELGGADEDVKRHFFSLPPHEMDSLLKEYGDIYGKPARDYARGAWDKWRTGQVHMSGVVAERLFDLLPPRMSMQAKYELVRTLWEKFSPRSSTRIRVGRGATIGALLKALQRHLLERVAHHTIPEPTRRRFEWLAAGDVAAEEALLNHFMDRERALILRGTADRLAVLARSLREDSAYVEHLSQSFRIGKHEVELLFDPSTVGMDFEDPLTTPSLPVADTSSASDNSLWEFIGQWGCLLPVGLAVFIAIIRGCQE